MEYFAHIERKEGEISRKQTVAQHVRAAAERAGACLQPVGLSEAGYLAALLHDVGKCKAEFQDYLFSENGKVGSVNHSFAGVRLLWEHFHGKMSESYTDVSVEFLTYAIGAHHGLFDCVDQDGCSGFAHRVEKQNIFYEESRNGFLSHCADWQEIDRRFAAADEQLQRLMKQLLAMAKKSNGGMQDFSFYLGVAARLLAAAVMEGDRRDTASFVKAWTPPPSVANKAYWQQRLAYMEEKLAAFPNKTPIDKARRTISDLCRRAAEGKGGVYRLHVPTGGGKTLSSLRFALAHAAAQDKKRILFVTPLLSILEQNAAVIRKYFGDDAHILEHHSNVIQPQLVGDDLDLRELAVDSWDAPVIITTMVQLLNTFFLGKTTSVRRFQSLVDAVVVIDEVQTVPNHMLTLFNLTVNFLSEVCHTTFLLCSATQPCFEKADHPLLREPIEVVPYSRQLWAPFHRTELKLLDSRRLEEIPEQIRSILKTTNSLLVVCNKRSEAAFLFQALREECENTFHLSASMCMQHRRDTLAQIEESLAHKQQKTLCIATQVIEAGVDISFGCVLRLAAGIDSVVQAAGRCNRNGESDVPAPVYLLNCSDENLNHLQEIRRAKTVTLSLQEQFRTAPETLDNDLFSDKAVVWYYQKLYREMAMGFQDYTLPKENNTLFSLLSSNTHYHKPEAPCYGSLSLPQAFRTAGKRFCVFDSNTLDAIVPYGEGAQLIAQLADLPEGDLVAWQNWQKAVKPYTVSLYQWQEEKVEPYLVRQNGAAFLLPQAYDGQLGFVIPEELSFMEV